MVLNGGGRAVNSPATFWSCLNCRRVMTLEELRWRRKLAMDAAKTNQADRPSSRVIPVSSGGLVRP